MYRNLRLWLTSVTLYSRCLASQFAVERWLMSYSGHCFVESMARVEVGGFRGTFLSCPTTKEHAGSDEPLAMATAAKKWPAHTRLFVGDLAHDRIIKIPEGNTNE